MVNIKPLSNLETYHSISHTQNHTLTHTHTQTHKMHAIQIFEQ